jgi:hypothetical protein
VPGGGPGSAREAPRGRAGPGDAGRPPVRGGEARRERGGIVFVDDDAAPGDVDPDDAVDRYMNDGDVPRRR